MLRLQTRPTQESYNLIGRAPYKVKEVMHLGIYKLNHMDDSEVPNTWHGLTLRKFYKY